MGVRSPTVDFDSIGPARQARAVTPHDTNELAQYSRGLIVGVAGDVALVFEFDTDPVVLPCLAGVLYPYAVKKVMATDTDAEDIVVVY